MLGRMKARKDKALAPNILESMTMAVTLSDRLRQAGIRECETNCETKTGNLGQNRKNQSKKGQAEKCNERNKKLQNLGNEFYSPDFKNCHQTPSKNCGSFSKALRRKIRGSAKKTIFASLDFIKDCQKYKKKVINPETPEFERERKSESVFSNPKRNLHIKKEPQKLHASETYSQIPLCDNIKKKKEALILDTWIDKEAENSCIRKDPLFFDQNTEEINMIHELINDEKKSQLNKKVSETSSHVKPFFDEFPSGNIAKIDKNYLQSLLSITKKKDKKYTNEDESKNNEEAIREKQGQKKGEKKFNEVSLENKVKTKKSEERDDAAEETIQISSYNKSVLAKILRDSTKSEAQVFVQKNKLYNQRSSEMKSEKNMAYTKSEFNDTRKIRKNRNKLLKNKNGELSDSVFPNEIPKVIDIKELWRREVREKSENSLSSDSSCTVSKNDADPEQKNSELESYKVLKKFVEEEVKKMSNESEKKNNLKEIESIEYNFKTNEFKSVNLKESEKVENICKKLKISMAENLNDEVDIIKNEMSPLKKKLVQAKHPKRYSIYEGEKINSTLLSALAEDKLKDQKEKKLLKQKEKGSERTPSQIINNWSILNRLEQAFLALGTPNFQGKNIKNPKPPLKGQELISKEKISIQKENASRKDQYHTEKIGKEPQKSKEIERKKGNRDASNTSHSTFKTSTQSFRNKRPEDGGQRNNIKDNQQKNKFKKESKNDSPQNNIPVKITECKRILTDQEKKKNFNQATQENIKKKSTVRSPAKPNVTVHEPRQPERKQNKKSPSKNNAQVKKNESCKKKLSKVLVQSKISSQSLQKKKTFDIIQKKNSFMVQPLKSKSCDKIDDNFELGNIKICFSQIKDQQLKKNDFFDKNMKDKPQSGDKNMKNEAETTANSFIPKTSAEVPFKTQPEYHENYNRAEMKEFLKVSRENSEKIPEGTTNQEKPCENEEETEEQMQNKKVLNNPSERVIKERSILSMSGKQQNPQESITILMQIEGKNASDIYQSSQTSNSESSEAEKSQNDLRSFLESATELTQKISSSTISKLNTSNVRLMDSNSTSNQKKIDIDRQESSLVELSKKLSSSSDFSSNNSISIKQASEIKMNEISEPNLPKCQTKTLWEQDIRHYNALVKEIMSHYNRINGFLTHSDYLQSFPSDSAELLSIKYSTDTDSMSNKPPKVNLHEYRKRIISEYQALPIFEYKNLLQKKKEENLLTKEATKRNLTVVKDVTTEMDLDVKDFQPKIQKVLDSQLYVDAENLIRRNHPKVKFKEKKSSLQEIVLDENVKMVSQKCLRASSMTKTFPPLSSSSVCAESYQKLDTIKSFQDNLTETVTSTSMEETESECLE